MERFPGLRTESDGYNVHFMFDKDVAVLMKDASKAVNYDAMPSFSTKLLAL